MKSPKKSSKLIEKSVESGIENILSRLRIIKKPAFKWLMDGIPVAVVAATAVSAFAGWYSGAGIDLLYLTGGLTVVVSVLLARTLFEQFPQVLLMIWRRGVLCLSPQEVYSADKIQSLDRIYVDFIQAAYERMNDWRESLCGIIGVVVAGWTIWLLDNNILQETYLNFRTPFSGYGTIVLIRLAFLMAGFVGGIIGWRILVVADAVAKLGKIFDFDLQINHPDGCGGLRPIGDLCLKLAYAISPLPILLGVWLVFLSFLDLRYLRMDPANIEPLVSTIVFLTIPVAVLCVFSFFFPLGSIHTCMLKAKSRLQIELDEISQEIHQLSTKLLVSANGLAPQEGTSVEEKIEFLKRVYARNSQIPTWPYRSTHIWGLISTQVVPSLGIISSIIGFIQGFRK
jgi:hypothetical protein